jgi:RimJ/RimL family protein N-acetyltransferase
VHRRRYPSASRASQHHGSGRQQRVCGAICAPKFSFRFIGVEFLAKETEALKKRIRQHIEFHPTLKLTRPAGTGEKPQKVPVRLNGGSLRSLERRYPHGTAVPMQKRLQDGRECYALQNDAGEYESFVWISSGHDLYNTELKTYMWVPEDVAYPYDAFTWPELCGRGLFTELIRGLVAASRLTHPLVRRFKAWVDTGNKASCRAFEKAGFRVYGSYTAAMVGPVRLVTGRPWIEYLGDYRPETGSASVQEQR